MNDNTNSEHSAAVGTSSDPADVSDGHLRPEGGVPGSLDFSRRTHMHLRRLADNGGWCVMPDDGHPDDECCGYPSREPVNNDECGPKRATEMRWR